MLIVAHQLFRRLNQLEYIHNILKVGILDDYVTEHTWGTKNTWGTHENSSKHTRDTVEEIGVKRHV